MTSTLRRFQVTPSDVVIGQASFQQFSCSFLLLQMRLPQVRSESYLLVCAEGVELSAWRRSRYSELS